MNVGFVINNNHYGENPQVLQKVNKWALKLIGFENSNLSQEDLLEFISLYVKPNSIQAFFYDSFNNFYSLFLNNIESFCRLVGKVTSTGTHTIRFLPLLDFFIVGNVYPSTTNDDLCDTFGRFGHVFQVSNYHILPNSSKFSHVLSGKREISFMLPGDKMEIFIPINVIHHPHRYHVKKFCSACVTEGHSVLNCPDIEDELKTEPSEENEPSSNTEGDFIIQDENAEFNKIVISAVVELKEENENGASPNITAGKESSLLQCNGTSLTSTTDEGTAMLPQNREGASFTSISYEQTALVPLNDEVFEHDLDHSVYSSPPQLLREKTSIALENLENEDSSELSSESLKLFDTSLPVPEEKYETKNSSKTNYSENTNRAKTCKDSNFMKNLFKKRKMKEDTFDNHIIPESEDSTEASEKSVHLAKKRRRTKRISSSANESTTKTRENDDHLQNSVKEPIKMLWCLSPEAEGFIKNSKGVLPPEVLRNIIMSDGRKPNIILDLIRRNSSDIDAVDRQLIKLYFQFRKSDASSYFQYHSIILKLLKIRQLLKKK